MANTKRFAFNVIMNWVAMVVGMVVPFFLTPLVVRTLGATAYGVWILAVSTVAYLNLLDLGLRSAIIRFVSKSEATGDLAEARNAIGAALWLRLVISAGVAVLSVVLALLFSRLFKIPLDMQWAAQVTVLMCGLGVAVTLVSGVFGAVLAAINRYDLLSTVTMLQTLARAVGVVLILHSGRGLISLACWELVVIVTSGLAIIFSALKIFPASRVPIARPDIPTLRMIWGYSFTMFIIIVAGQIIFSTDNMVIGSFLAVSLVSFYSIGGSLTAYSLQVVTALSTTFIPLASGLEASGKTDELRKLLLRGTQATLALALPISLTLLLRGKTFIALWMGHQYSEVSGTVLQILLISQFFTVANTTAANIMFATGKHKAVAKCATIEAALNLGVSILLVKSLGIYGVAWGTSATMAAVHLAFWPRYVHKMLGIPAYKYIWDGWIKITLCSVPFGIVCYLADRYWPARSMAVFFSQVLVTLPVYAGCVTLIFREEVFAGIRHWQRSRLPQTEAIG